MTDLRTRVRQQVPGLEVETAQSMADPRRTIPLKTE